MENSENQITDQEAAGLIELGVLLGKGRAFGLVAGCCSGVQAATLRTIREEKLYKRCSPSWKDFCATHLNLSRTQADHIIGLLDEFGPGYFELAQLTRVSPETYRALEPSIKDGAIHSNGEEIEINPENADKVVRAVNEFRRTAPPHERHQPSTHERFEALDKSCAAILAEFDYLVRQNEDPADFGLFQRTLAKMRAALARVELQIGF